MQWLCSSTVDRSVATLFANYAAPSLRCGLRRLCYLPHRHAQTCTAMHTHMHTCTSTNEHALTLVIPPRWIWQPQSVSVSCPLQQLQLAARHKQTHTYLHTHMCVCVARRVVGLVGSDAPRVLSSAAFVGKIKNFEWAASGFKDLH